MKPRRDQLVKRPFVYRTAKETQEPGYLAARFRAIRAEQARATRHAEALAAEQAAKVRAITKREVA